MSTSLKLRMSTTSKRVESVILDTLQVLAKWRCCVVHCNFFTLNLTNVFHRRNVSPSGLLFSVYWALVLKFLVLIVYK